MADLQAMLDRIGDLPTLPDVVVKVTRMVRDERTSAQDINKVISTDPSLSAKILKIVNSPFYGFPRRITSINYAVVILGFNAVRNLALSAFIFDAFGRKSTAKDFDLKGFWEHTVGVAVTASNLSQRYSPSQADDAFMGGLLHDIGKVVMNQYLHQDLLPVMEEIDKRDCLFIEAEEAVLEYDHREIGAALLERWNLPVSLVECVRCHHGGAPKETAPQLCAIVHLADILTRSLCIGNGGDAKIPRLDPAAWEALDFTWEDVARVMDQVEQEMERADSLLDV